MAFDLDNPILEYLDAICVSLQGFVNAIVWLSDPYFRSRVKRAHFCLRIIVNYSFPLSSSLPPLSPSSSSPFPPLSSSSPPLFLFFLAFSLPHSFSPLPLPSLFLSSSFFLSLSLTLSRSSLSTSPFYSSTS